MIGICNITPPDHCTIPIPLSTTTCPHSAPSLSSGSYIKRNMTNNAYRKPNSRQSFGLPTNALFHTSLVFHALICSIYSNRFVQRFLGVCWAIQQLRWNLAYSVILSGMLAWKKSSGSSWYMMCCVIALVVSFCSRQSSEKVQNMRSVSNSTIRFVVVVSTALQPFAERMAVAWIFVELENPFKFLRLWPWSMAAMGWHISDKVWDSKNYLDIPQMSQYDTNFSQCIQSYI